MSLTKFIALGLFASLVTFSSAKAEQVECPDMLLTRMVYFNQHLELEKQGIPGEFQEDFDYVTGVFAADPNMINCRDHDLGDTPLQFSFHTLFNLCTLPESASWLIAHGADVNQAGGDYTSSALYYAVEGYGSIWGTPDPIELKNEDVCGEETPQAPFKALIKTMIDKGADVNAVGEWDKSVKQVAADLQVTDVLQQ